jgi:hypothetical protein
MFYCHEDDEGADLAGSLARGDAGPAGAPVFCCSLEEVRKLVCRTAERERWWLRFEAFLADAGVARNFSHLHLTGPFFTSRERACEIEAVLQARSNYGPAAFAALEPFLALGLREIRERYGVRLRFWVKGAPVGLRFVRGRSPAESRGRAGRRRRESTRQGIVRVELGAGR